MAIMDLQGMQAPNEVRAGNSRGSKGCGGSRISLLLCG
jgi:hypothetical protein